MEKKFIVSKIVGIFILGIFASFFTSCSSVPKSITNEAPVAVVSASCNPSIPWYMENNFNDEDDDNDYDTGLLSSAVNKLFNGKSEEILTGQDRIDYAEESFRLSLQELAEIEVIEKDVVINSEIYEDLPSGFLSLSSSVNATGYKDLSTLGAKNARMLMKDIGAKSLVILQFHFNKELVSGTQSKGEIRPIVTLTVRVLNENGSDKINDVIVVRSDETLKIRDKNYDKGEFVKLFPKVIDNTVNQFIVKYIN